MEIRTPPPPHIDLYLRMIAGIPQCMHLSGLCTCYIRVLIQILNGRVKTCSIYAVVDGNFGGVTGGTRE